MIITEAKLKRWIDYIQSGNLEEVIDGIQEAESDEIDEKTNKQIFKLLLYLSHTADQCNKTNHVTGEKLYSLARLLCNILIDIPDSNKFVLSLFHIIRCLLTIKLYTEAAGICRYFKLKNLHYSDANTNDLLVKIASLWSHATNNVFNAYKEAPQQTIYLSELERVMGYELEIIQIVYKEYPKYLLLKISSYMEKHASISKNSDTTTFKLHKFLIEYLQTAKIFLTTDGKYTIFRHALYILTRLIRAEMSETGAKDTMQALKKIKKKFADVFLADQECYECFGQFQNLCTTLIVPIQDLTDKSAQSLYRILENYKMITKRYKYNGAVKWALYNVADVLELLFPYWENHAKSMEKSNFNNNILQEIMNLVTLVSSCCVKQTWRTCKSCDNKECTVRTDIFNAVVIKSRCVNSVCKLNSSDTSTETYALARKLLEENISWIYELRESGCKCWSDLWSTCGIQLYNLGIKCEKSYEESALTYSLLCTCVIKFEGTQGKNRYINLENPLSSVLHRLCVVHYNKGKYREAMTVAALNGILSYGDKKSKAFRMWANIKYKCQSQEKILNLTMFACLKADRKKIKELGLQLVFEDFNLIKLCVREAKGLQEAKVNLSSAIYSVLREMETLNAAAIERAHVVQLLAYHLLSFDHKEDISEYLKSTISELRESKRMTLWTMCSVANLQFHTFISELQIMNEQTQTEMENTKFTLYAPKTAEVGENDARDVVPAYSMINIKQDSQLKSSLRRSLKNWTACLQSNIKTENNEEELTLTLNTIILAGEYSRLHRYHDCETKAWILAHKLATILEDHFAIIYITGRSISLREINHDWIIVSKTLATKYKDDSDEDKIHIIATFYISLADYYFETGMLEEGKELLNCARNLPGISFLYNTVVYLYSLDRILWNYDSYNENLKHEQYSRYIVEILYAMIAVEQELAKEKPRNHKKYLFSYDILFSAATNLSLRMNSLLSFREISAHLVRRLTKAQSLGAITRVAELLKCLCYIDLSRGQISDCEVKLQGLEHILRIDTFQLSVNTKQLKTPRICVMTTPTRIVDPVRDIPHNGASPVLPNKVFEIPDFLRHRDCTCYACENASYQYLVFSSTYIRAQLYTLQGYRTEALEHYCGAFEIKETLISNRKDVDNYGKKILNKNNSTWHERYYLIDYILLLLDFAYFLNSAVPEMDEKISNILLVAVQICRNYKLVGHPIYMSLQEFILNRRFKNVFNDADYSAFTVPAEMNIDVDKYMEKPNIEYNTCFTPATNNNYPKKPLGPQRNRTPPMLKLTKISINYSDDEDKSPLVSIRRKMKPPKRLIRRILDDESADENDTNIEDSTVSKTKSSVNNNTETQKTSTESRSVKDIVNRVAATVPDLSEHLYKLANNLEVPATNENVEIFIEKIELLRVNTKGRVTRSTRSSKQLNINDYNSQINEAIKLFKDMAIRENSIQSQLSDKPDSSIDVIEETPPPLGPKRRTAQRQCSVVAEGYNSRKSARNIVPYIEYDGEEKTASTSGNRKTITRSTKRTIANKDTQASRIPKKT